MLEQERALSRTWRSARGWIGDRPQSGGDDHRARHDLPGVVGAQRGEALAYGYTERIDFVERGTDAERRRVPGLVEFVEQNEPQLIAFNEYVNDNGTEVTVVQVQPDAASMQTHLGIIGERAAQAYDETLDATLAIQIFGPVDPQMLNTMRAQTGERVSLTVAGEPLGGFTRSR